MSSDYINDHGLTRTIPHEKKQQIRKECGFGCIICGSALYHYHHIDPEFKDAKSHEIDKIGIVCGGCHDPASRKFWYTNKYKKARLNPYCLSQKESKLDMGINPDMDLTINLGKFTYINTPTIIEIEGQNILSISKPKEVNSPPLISAIFYDKNNVKIASIEENEWIGSTDAFDIQTKGGSFIINSSDHDIDLKINIIGENILEVERMNLCFLQCRIECNSQTGFRISNSQCEVNLANSWIFDSAEFGVKVINKVVYIGANKPIKNEDGSYTQRGPYAVNGGSATLDIQNAGVSLRTPILKRNEDFCSCESGAFYKDCCKINEIMLFEFLNDKRITEVHMIAKRAAHNNLQFRFEYNLNKGKIGSIYYYKQNPISIVIKINTAKDKILIDHLAASLYRVTTFNDFYILYFEIIENYPLNKDFLRNVHEMITLIFISKRMADSNFNIEGVFGSEIKNAIYTLKFNLNIPSCDSKNVLAYLYLNSILDIVSKETKAELNHFLATINISHLHFYQSYNEIIQKLINQPETRFLGFYQNAIYDCLSVINSYYKNKLNGLLEGLKKFYFLYPSREL